jgi:cell division septation protein DedD
MRYRQSCSIKSRLLWTLSACLLVFVAVARAQPQSGGGQKGGVRKEIDVHANGWAFYDHMVHANSANWGNPGWYDWGTSRALIIPEGRTFSHSENFNGYTVDISGEITKERVVWLRLKRKEPGLGGVGREFELEIQDLPVQPNTSTPVTGYTYIADSIIQDKSRPHDVGRFIKKLTYELTFADGQKLALDHVDWNHLSGPQTRGVDPLTHFTVYNIDSFVSVSINYVTPENGPAPVPASVSTPEVTPKAPQKPVAPTHPKTAPAPASVSTPEVTPKPPVRPVAPAPAEKTGGAEQRFEVYNLGEGVNILQSADKPKGTLSVGGGKLKYQEAGKAVFSAGRAEIAEIDANSVLGYNTGTFHVILKSGKTYNFAPASLSVADGQKMLGSIKHALP